MTFCLWEWQFTKLCGITSLIFTVAGCAFNQPNIDRALSTSHDISGAWISIEFIGIAVDDHIQFIEYHFDPDGSFDVTARMSDNKSKSYKGTFKVLTSVIQMKIPEVGEHQMPYELSHDELIIKDPEIDAWVKLKRKILAE